MNAIISHSIGFEPDAVVCTCGRRWEYSEWGGVGPSKEVAKLHAKFGPGPIMEPPAWSTPASAELASLESAFGSPMARWLSSDLGSGALVVKLAQTDTFVPTTTQTIPGIPELEVSGGPLDATVRLPLNGSQAVAADLLVGAARAERALTLTHAQIAEDVDNDGAPLGVSVVIPAPPGIEHGHPNAIDDFMLSREVEDSEWKIAIPTVEFTDVAGARLFLKALADAIGLAESLNAGVDGAGASGRGRE